MFRFFQKSEPEDPNKFNPLNPNHLNLIKEKLGQFNTHRKDLQTIDCAMGIPAVISVPLLFAASSSFGILVVIGAYYYGNQYLRHDLRFETTYQTDLQELLCIYEWAQKSNPSFEGDILKELKETIAMYAPSQETKTEAPLQGPANCWKVISQAGEAFRLWRYGYKTPEEIKADANRFSTLRDIAEAAPGAVRAAANYLCPKEKEVEKRPRKNR